jgi:hypothetical protein
MQNRKKDKPRQRRESSLGGTGTGGSFTLTLLRTGTACYLKIKYPHTTGVYLVSTYLPTYRRFGTLFSLSLFLSLSLFCDEAAMVVAKDPFFFSSLAAAAVIVAMTKTRTPE